MSEDITEDTKPDVKYIDMLNTVKCEPSSGPECGYDEIDKYDIGTLGSLIKEEENVIVEIDDAEDKDNKHIDPLSSFKSEPELKDNGSVYVKDVNILCKQESYDTHCDIKKEPVFEQFQCTSSSEDIAVRDSVKKEEIVDFANIDSKAEVVQEMCDESILYCDNDVCQTGQQHQISNDKGSTVRECNKGNVILVHCDNTATFQALSSTARMKVYVLHFIK